MSVAAVLIGVTHALAAVLILRYRVPSFLWSRVAWFSMVIWIMVETGIIRGFSWPQGLHFTVGIAELSLVLALLGIVSWLPPLQLGYRQAIGRSLLPRSGR
jgi:hypothetical protein